MDQLGARMVLENAKEYLANSGYDQDEINAAVLSQSYLRLEQPLTASTTLINFPVLINQQGSGTVRPTEKRLQLQDAFLASSISVYLTLAASATDTQFELKTYNSPVTFSTSATGLNGFYNGFIQITVNNNVISPAIDVERFRIAPQTQLTGAANPPMDQFSGAGTYSNSYPLEPNLIMIGQKNSQVNVVLPAAISTAVANTYIVIILRGVLAQNVTVVS